MIRAYRRTRYTAPGVSVLVGRRCAAAEQLLGGQPGGFVTAWNPRSRKMPAGWNERANRRLRARLRRLPHWPGWGEGRRWREAHFLVAAPPARLLVVARLFRQGAIVVLAPPRPAQLRLIPPGAAARDAGQRSIAVAISPTTSPAGSAAASPASMNGSPAP